LNPSSNAKYEELSEEIRILKRKLDDAVYNMSRQQQAPQMAQPLALAPQGDYSRFEARLEQLDKIIVDLQI
jgi:hypothetical protein